MLLFGCDVFGLFGVDDFVYLVVLVEVVWLVVGCGVEYGDWFGLVE